MSARTEIHCYPTGFFPQYGKCCFGSIAVIQGSEGPIRINVRFSTKEKWRAHDIGHTRLTNIAAWCGDYDASRKLYDQRFGEGGWTTVWHESNPFPNQMVIFP